MHVGFHRAVMMGWLFGALVTACGPHDTASHNYYLVVENRADEPLVITPLNDDVEPAFGNDFYLIPADGSRYWAWGGVVYDRPAAVFVYDASCAMRGKVLIPSNSPGRYLVSVDASWEIRLSEIKDDSTAPPSAGDNREPCESAPSARLHVTLPTLTDASRSAAGWEIFWSGAQRS